MYNILVSRFVSGQRGERFPVSMFFLYARSAMDSSTDSSTPRHSIGVAARRTGLKADLIRAWERRYGAVEPARSPTRRRLYSDDQVRRLQLLSRAVQGGRNIGDVATLPDADLEELIAGDAAAAVLASDRPGVAEPSAPGDGAQAEALVDVCLAAIRRLDARALEAELKRASVALSRTHLVERILEPVLRTVGEQWRSGELRPVHEHMASAVVRSFLGGLTEAYEPPESAPRIVVTTPLRQRHEMGGLLAAASAAAEGWDVLYLGPDLPAEEIAAAARSSGARAVGLSITYPPDDPALAGELARLGRLLSPGVLLLIGGRSAPAYRAVIEGAGGRLMGGLDDLRRLLAGLREPAPGAPGGDG